MIEFAIIDRDTLRALGLKYLIDRFFDKQATVASNITDLDVNEITPATMFFTTAQNYVASQDFFLPRRLRTVILSTDDLTELATLDPQRDESAIIHDLSLLISERNTDNSRTHNELSQREIDVLRLVAMGYINKEIADELSISFNTVLTHRKNITAKLGIRSVSGLGFYAMMNGYITESDIKR